MTDRNSPTVEYVEDNMGLGYKNVCSICFCSVREIFMEKHLAWHIQTVRDAGQR